MSSMPLPQGTPLWIITTMSILVLLGMISKQVAEWKNPIGALAKWFQTGQLREVERSESLDQAIEAAVRRRVSEEVTSVMDRLKKLEDRLTSAEK